jgi:UDP-N-acetyl-D-mannosaminouronate:lipid I N-acetyl-D-mannosaminouronosyltransferase
MVLKQKGLEAIKIPGAEFWLDIVEKFYRQKSFYLVGSTQEVIEMTIKKLEHNYPGILIKGYRNGFLNELDKEILIEEFQKKRPEIVFIAQGSPRQEYFMDELIKIHPALYMGLGGSFDVFCGLKKRAPKFFLNFNLEWFYRLISEPTRFKRQMVLIKFFILLKGNKL